MLDSSNKGDECASAHSLDENVVQCSPSAIPADANSCRFESVGKFRTGKLDSLITIEDVRCSHLECSIQRFQAKTRIKRDRDFPSQHRPTEPIDNRHQIDKPSLQADVGDITTPHLIAALDALATRAYTDTAAQRCQAHWFWVWDRLPPIPSGGVTASRVCD
jgi:hypothetical protein